MFITLTDDTTEIEPGQQWLGWGGIRSEFLSSGICPAVNEIHAVWNSWQRHYYYQTNWVGLPGQRPSGRVKSLDLVSSLGHNNRIYRHQQQRLLLLWFYDTKSSGSSPPA